MWKISKELNKENVYSFISGLDIFKLYCKGASLKHKFSSEFRQDNNPSCSIKFMKNDFLYKDFGSNLTLFPINYVMYKYNLTYYQALDKINFDFMLGLGNNSPVDINATLRRQNTITYNKAERSIIKIKKKEFSIEDINFWKQFYISVETLNKFKVNSISHYWINDKVYITKKLAYSYLFYKNLGILMRKLYFPEYGNKRSRFITNGDNTVIQGWHMLPKYGNLLIITKALKDVMTLYEAGYNSIAPTNEGSFIPLTVFNKLKSRWKKIIICYDNDETGIKKSNKFSNELGINNIFVPDQKCKDISDFSKKYNLNELKTWLDSKIGTF